MLIEATIAEVTLNDSCATASSTSSRAAASPAASQQPARRRIAAQPRSLPGFNFLFTPGSSNITIDALSRLTNVKVLSSPSVVVQDNSEAVLTVGEEVPVQTAAAAEHAPRPIERSSTDRVPRHRRHPAGAAADQLQPGGVARDRAGGQPRRSDPSTAANALTPTFTQRKITSRVNVQSGQTVVLGGLIQDSEERGRDRIPVLGEIPVRRQPVRHDQQRQHAHRADRVHHAAGDPQPGGRARRQRGAALAAAVAAAGRRGVRCRRSRHAPGTRPRRPSALAPQPLMPPSAPRRAIPTACRPAPRARWPAPPERAGPDRWPGCSALVRRQLRRHAGAARAGRLARHVVGRSQCPACGTHAPVRRDLVPLWSWLVEPRPLPPLRRALCPFYPLVEIGAAVDRRPGARPGCRRPQAWLAALLGWWLLALALIDLRSLAAAGRR